ncbi:hypothetical protein [Nocardia sp. NPDC004711]
MPAEAYAQQQTQDLTISWLEPDPRSTGCGDRAAALRGLSAGRADRPAQLAHPMARSYCLAPTSVYPPRLGGDAAATTDDGLDVARRTLGRDAGRVRARVSVLAGMVVVRP